MVSEITANGTTYSLGSEMTDLIDLLGMCYSDVEPMADLSKSELKSLRRWLKVHALPSWHRTAVIAWKQMMM
jgi:hypothetical protein